VVCPVSPKLDFTPTPLPFHSRQTALDRSRRLVFGVSHVGLSKPTAAVLNPKSKTAVTKLRPACVNVILPSAGINLVLLSGVDLLEL
jgi:hypothetical protein